MDKKYWLSEPEEHDFPAAQDFLKLHFSKKTARQLTDRLRRSTTIIKKAKDVLRASGLPLLPEDNSHVKQNLKKMKKVNYLLYYL